MIRPFGYVETQALLRKADCLVTDSGGMQKEAYFLGTPCLTLRSTTEWPVSLKQKPNQLIKDPGILPAALRDAQTWSGTEKDERRLSLFGNGHASARITKILEQQLL